MRRLNVASKKQALRVVKELDAFPKVPESYQETTPSGGGVSILVFVLIGILVVSEIQYFTTSKFKFDYDVDTKMEGRLKINIDMTAAMKCEHVGADVLDLTGQDLHGGRFGEFKQEEVHFELSPDQRAYQSMMQHINQYIRNEYHAIQDFLWSSGMSGLVSSMPKREIKADGPPDACRIHGSVTVNKVAGNFHITAGKHLRLQYFSQHMHLANVAQEDYNFSHRIDHFSFGEPLAGLVSPLDGDERVTDDNLHMFQYFIQVVPTKVRTRSNNLDTYQYAVTDRNRTINHSKGSHGIPGIFVKYDLSSLQVSVKEEYQPFWQFLVRLCGIIGGVFATSGVLHSIVGVFIDLLCCRLKIGKFRQQEERPLNTITQENADILKNSFPAETVAGVSLLSTEEDAEQEPMLQPQPPSL